MFFPLDSRVRTNATIQIIPLTIDNVAASVLAPKTKYATIEITV